MTMRDFITVFIYGAIILAVFAFFINLLPILLPVIGVFILISYFRRKKAADTYRRYQNQQDYAQQDFNSSSGYKTSGNIRSDVIDVEYKETVEK